MRLRLHASFVKRFQGGREIRLEELKTPEEAGVTVLFGSSGAGKTTVLRCLAGLERPEEGSIRLGEEVWFDASNAGFTPPRDRRVGFVPQDYALFPHLNVEQNIAYGLGRTNPSAKTEAVAKTIRWLGLSGLEKRLPEKISGGEQQRVALARALAWQPKLLLLDEPLSALDSPSRVRLRGELRRLLDELDIPTILVTHDRTEALALGDQLVVMETGRIVQQGKVHEVFSRPANLAVAGIVAIETVIPGRIASEAEGLLEVKIGTTTLKALRGDLPSDTKDVMVCIRAEDVMLMRDQGFRSSPRNCLSGRVQQITREGAIVRIDLDCGFPLMAILTKQACDELGIREHTQIWALIKAPHIHLIPHASQHRGL